MKLVFPAYIILSVSVIVIFLTQITGRLKDSRYMMLTLLSFVALILIDSVRRLYKATKRVGCA